MLLAGAGAGQAQSFDASKIDHPMNLAGTWLVKAGDDPAYAQRLAIKLDKENQ